MKACAKAVLPSTWKTCLWLIKLTWAVSFTMLLLKWFGLLPVIAGAVEPLLSSFGLPGETALPLVSGYFVNVYSALAIISTLSLTTRQMTILGTMILCAHSMILETSVLKKTGTSAALMVAIRTAACIASGFILNLILPADMGAGKAATAAKGILPAKAMDMSLLWPMTREWLISSLKLTLMLVAIIFTLNILQRILTEFGIMDKISKVLSPLMTVFGLPRKTSFLWIVANIIGLGYGAAALIDEVERGALTKRDVLLVDTHVCTTHSNIEDLLLMTASGGVCWIMLFFRWGISMVNVWAIRLGEFCRAKLGASL